MDNTPKNEDGTPVAGGGKQTPVEPEARRTGSDARDSDVKDGAQPEAPGNKNTDTPGDPNQGTEAR